MKRMLFLFFTFFAATSLSHASSPNFLVILVDDMGYSDIGCYGGEMHTPHLDRLAERGIRYSDFYNSARCWPTRAALLTGYYAQQVNRDSVAGLGKKAGRRPGWAKLLPTYLRSAGYRSYHSGKWHVDGAPTKEGFDRSFRFDVWDNFFDTKVLSGAYREFPALKPDGPLYATTGIADWTIGVLRDHAENHADQPFFSYVAFTAPHFPLHALAEDVERVGDRYAVGWETVRRDRWKRQQELGLMEHGQLSAVEPDVGPPYHFPKALAQYDGLEVNRPVPWDSLTAEQQTFQATKMAIHAAMVERVDIEVGRILDQLQAMNALEDTVIFFFSDNGASAEIMVRGAGHDPEARPGSRASYLCLGPGWSNASNTPFRKHKTWTHEGGAATPLIVHWPEGLKHTGGIRHAPGHAIDLVPTMLELAGATGLPERPLPFPGKSLVPTFRGEEPPPRTLWWSHEGNNALRDGDWKLVKTRKGAWELYDLASDRAETHDLAAEQPQRVTELAAKWQAKVEEMKRVYRKP